MIGPSPPIRVGTSGWSYRHWRGRFYPTDLPMRRWLAFYAEHFDTVEVNATFYRLPRPETLQTWRDTVPSGFRFAVKASRYLTHVTRLQDPDGVGRFLEVVAVLGPRMGPVLVQLPPRFPPDPSRLDAFLGAFPTSVEVAVEFRDPRWYHPDVQSLLVAHGAALVWTDHDLAPSPEWVTAPFVYVRRHGPVRYAGRYGTRRLHRLAESVRATSRPAWIYFDNDAAAAAVDDARALKEILSAPA